MRLGMQASAAPESPSCSAADHTTGSALQTPVLVHQLVQ